MKRLLNLFALFLLVAVTAPLDAHPMGNFSINHHTTIELSSTSIQLDHVLDFAEIPTLQMFSHISPDILSQRINQLAADWARGLELDIAGDAVRLDLAGLDHQVVPGAAGLNTLRVRLQLVARWEGRAAAIHFSDRNFSGRLGWKEVVVKTNGAFTFPEGNPFAEDRSSQLTIYPADPLSSAPEVVEASIRIEPSRSMTFSTSERPVPTPAASFAPKASDRLSSILLEDRLSVRLLLLGVAIAFALGALHALSPGHGKTIVAAYLVGNGGTARHALFLGLIVTLAHTAGVFLLGFVTLFLTQYLVPEKLYPWIGFFSGLSILWIGVSVFHQRLHALDHSHAPSDGSGASGRSLDYRNLFALGVSGGLLPCPSALVVLLSAIALHRVGLGIFLIVAFSMGLASVLVGVGVAAVHVGRRFSNAGSESAITQITPVVSAFIISVLGIGISIEALVSGNLLPATLKLSGDVLAVLALGLVLGLKHATDADHLVAVTTFLAGEQRILRGCRIGIFWGIGHTLSLAAAGLLVIGLRINIPEWLAARLELGVAAMLIVLGWRAVTSRQAAKNVERAHVHDGLRPLLVGAVHGAAGSAALMLLVLSTIQSPLAGFLYILIFGVGSIAGMMAASLMLAFPLHWGRRRAGIGSRSIQVSAGVLSCVFGLYLGAQIWLTLP